MTDLYLASNTIIYIQSFLSPSAAATGTRRFGVNQLCTYIMAEFIFFFLQNSLDRKKMFGKIKIYAFFGLMGLIFRRGL